jgi:MFS family permease
MFPPRPSALAWADPDLRRLLLARLVSCTGNAVAPIALAFAVLDTGASAGTVGLVVTARFAAQLATLVVASAVADRWSRKALMVGSDVTAGLAQAAIAVLLATGHTDLVLLLPLQGLTGAAAALFYPASSAAMPALAGAAIRQRANAWLQATSNAGLLLGGSLAGVLVASIGAAPTLSADAASFGVSALLAVRIRTSLRVTAGHRRETMLTGLRAGWAQVSARPWFLIVMSQFALVNAATAGGFNILGPLLLHDLPNGPRTWAFIVTVQSVGLVLGALAAIRLPARRPLLVGDGVVLLLPLPLLLLGVSGPLAVVLVAALCAGAAKSVFNTMWWVTLQTDVPNQVLARVSAYDALISYAAIPLGTAVAAPLAGSVGVRGALVAFAVLSLGATSLALLTRPVRAFALPGPEPAEAAAPTEESLIPQ